MNARIVNSAQLIGLPQAELASSYGLKTAGVVQLMDLKPLSPVAYEVPRSWAIAAGQGRNVTDAELMSAYRDLIDGETNAGAIMVRSSAVDEESGQNTTRAVAFSKRSPARDFAKFRETVHEVAGVSPAMGVLIMPMVRNRAVRREGMDAIGWDNISFVADTHSSINPHEMYVALVSGLGTRVVAADAEFIPVTVDSASGRITSFVNRSDDAITGYMSAEEITTPSDYRQQNIDYFALSDDIMGLKEGGLSTAPMTDRAWGWIEGEEFNRLHMSIVQGLFRKGIKGYVTDLEFKHHPWLHLLGITPFDNPASLPQLVGALQFLSSTSTIPLQIEGAFAGLSAVTPTLYQCIEVPRTPTSPTPLALEGARLFSHTTIGVGEITCPLVCIGPTFHLDGIFALDALFAQSGYAFITKQHTPDLIAATPHCKIRFSVTRENLASHSVTFMRMQLAKNPASGHLYAMEVKYRREAPIHEAWAKISEKGKPLFSPNISLISRHAHIQSNGQVMRVDW